VIALLELKKTMGSTMKELSNEKLVLKILKTKKEVNQSTSPEIKPCVTSISSTEGFATTNQVFTNKDSGSRYISAAIKRSVWRKAKNECTFEHHDSITNSAHRCGSKYGIEIEHIFPFALGGTHDLENLTLRCRMHNQFAAKKFFGFKVNSRKNKNIKKNNA